MEYGSKNFITTKKNNLTGLKNCAFNHDIQFCSRIASSIKDLILNGLQPSVSVDIFLKSSFSRSWSHSANKERIQFKIASSREDNFTGCSSGLNLVSSEICYLVLFRMEKNTKAWDVWNFRSKQLHNFTFKPSS